MYKLFLNFLCICMWLSFLYFSTVIARIMYEYNLNRLKTKKTSTQHFSTTTVFFFHFCYCKIFEVKIRGGYPSPLPWNGWDWEAGIFFLLERSRIGVRYILFKHGCMRGGCFLHEVLGWRAGIFEMGRWWNRSLNELGFLNL